MVKRGMSKRLKVLTKRYMKLLIDRKITVAEKVLEKIREESSQTQWHRGFYNALEGMVIGLKSRDSRYVYINRIDPKDIQGMKRLKREFSKQLRSSLQGDFDKGFFTAWLEYVKALEP